MSQNSIVEKQKWIKKNFNDNSLQAIIKVRVNYRSGHSFEFWCTEFTVDKGKWEWVAFDQSNSPLIMGVDDAVESVHQVDVDFVKKSDLEQ